MTVGPIRFFMTSVEFVEFLRGIVQPGVRLLRPVRLGGYEAFCVSPDSVELPEILFLAAVREDVAAENAELHAGGDWVRVTPPREVGGKLYIGDASPARKDSSRRLFTKVRKALREQAPFATYATNITTQKSHLYKDVRSSTGARQLSTRGVELCQEGVVNIRYRAEST